MISADELIRNLRYDCWHYLGDRPCAPHVLSGKRCTCDEFQPISRRGIIVKLGAAGDVLRSTPLLRALNPLGSGTKVLWITHSPELLPPEACDAVRPTAATLARIAAQSWDFCWNLDKDLDACAIAEVANAKEISGYILRNGQPCPANERAWHKFATGVDDPYSRQNTKTYVEEVFDIVGVPFQKEEYWLRSPPEVAIAAAQAVLPEGRVVGLNIGAGRRWPSRIWPASYWLQLIDMLKASGFVPFLLGGPEEAELSAALVSSTGCLSSGIQPLDVFYAMIHRCECVVTAVTMALHLAIAARRPLVLLNNIFNPYEFELYGRGEIVGPVPACDCYYAGVCRTGRNCINEISAEAVMGAVLRHVQAF